MRGDLSSVGLIKKSPEGIIRKRRSRQCLALIKRTEEKHCLLWLPDRERQRTVIALCDVLLQNGWVKNILFLADRTSLVTQAKRSFVNMLPDLSVANLCEEKSNLHAHCIFQLIRR